MHGCHAPKVNGVCVPKVLLPKEVAEALESIWSDYKDKKAGGGKDFCKLTVLTNWGMMSDKYREQYKILPKYFRENPIDYINAIQRGYEVKVEYLKWDQAYQGMKEGNIYLRYSKSDMKLDYYKIRGTELVFTDKQTNKLWRHSETTLNMLMEDKFVLVES